MSEPLLGGVLDEVKTLRAENEQLQAELSRLRRVNANLQRIVAWLDTGQTYYQRKPARFRYRNHRGETAVRRARFGRLFFGREDDPLSSQWLVLSWDEDKQAMRTFAVADVLEWIDEETPPLPGTP